MAIYGHQDQNKILQVGMACRVKDRTQSSSQSLVTFSSLRENPDPASMKERHWVGPWS